MLRDRGTMKWTSLMLPEHVRMLKSLWREQDLPTRIQLDPQEQERLNQLLVEATAHQSLIHILIFENNEYVCTTGTIVSTNQTSGYIVLDLLEGARMSISVYDIFDLQLVESY